MLCRNASQLATNYSMVVALQKSVATCDEFFRGSLLCENLSQLATNFSMVDALQKSVATCDEFFDGRCFAEICRNLRRFFQGLMLCRNLLQLATNYFTLTQTSGFCPKAAAEYMP